MRVRYLFYGPQKLRAPWRILLFLTVSAALAAGLSLVVGLLLPAPTDRLWGIGLSSLVATIALVAASAIMMRAVEREPLSALGLVPGDLGRDWNQGAFIGGAFMAVVIAVQAILGWLGFETEPGGLLGWLEHVAVLGLVLAVAAASEELIFRGYPFQVLVEGLGVWPAIIVSSALFGGIHVFNPGVDALAVVNISLAGALMAAAYLRTRSLWTATGLHWAWNWMMAAVLDLPVSGLDFDSPGYDLTERGPDVFTGGAFGPEAGLLATALVLPLIAWVLRTRQLQPSARMRELGSLVDHRLTEKERTGERRRRP